MKKIVLSVIALFCCITSLFADDAAAVKQAVIRDFKFAKDGKYKESLKYHAKDVVIIDQDVNRTLYYKDILMMVNAIDGKHPEEFMIFAFKARTNTDPTPEQEKKLREYARSEEFQRNYPMYIDQLMSTVSLCAELNFNTLKIISVEVKGNLATVVVEYENFDSRDKELRRREKKSAVYKLRKENGIWKFIYQSSKKIK